MNAIDILEARNTSIRQKSEYALGQFLHDDCKIEYFGAPQIHSKDAYLKKLRRKY